MSAFKVVLARSGVTLTVSEDKSLLDVLLEAGYQVSYRCKNGYCGNCGVLVLDGIPEHLDDVMMLWEQAQNKLMMSCVSRCKDDTLTLDM